MLGYAELDAARTADSADELDLKEAEVLKEGVLESDFLQSSGNSSDGSVEVAEEIDSDSVLGDFVVALADFVAGFACFVD